MVVNSVNRFLGFYCNWIGCISSTLTREITTHKIELYFYLESKLILSRDDLARIKNHLEPTKDEKQEMIRRANEERKRLHEMSVSQVKSWTNTVLVSTTLRQCDIVLANNLITISCPRVKDRPILKQESSRRRGKSSRD